MATKKSNSKKQDKITFLKVANFITITPIILIFFAIPLFFTGLTSKGTGFDKLTLFYILVLLSLIGWSLKILLTKKIELKKTPFGYFWLLALAAMALSSAFSVDIKSSLIGSYGNAGTSISMLLATVILFYTMVNNLEKKHLIWIFWSFVASISLVAIYSLLQIFGVYTLPFSFTGYRHFNPIGSLSGLSIFLIGTLPLLLIAATKTNDLISLKSKNAKITIKTISLLVLITVLITLYILNNYTFWPAALVGTIIMLMFFLSQILPVKSKNLYIPVLVFALLIVFLAIGNFRLIKAPVNLPTEVSLSAKYSFEIAREGLIDNPLLGSGPSTFYYDFYKFKNTDFNNTALWNMYFDKASGFFFELVATLGILGTLALLILVFSILYKSFARLTENKQNEYTAIMLGFFCSLASFLILVFPFVINNSNIISIILVSVFLASSLPLINSKTKKWEYSFQNSLKTTSAFLVLWIVIFTSFIWQIRFFAADVYAKQALLSDKPTQKIVKLQNAIRLFPYEDVYYLKITENYINLAQNKLQENPEVAEDVLKAIENAVTIGKKAINLSPNKVTNQKTLATLYKNILPYKDEYLGKAKNLYEKILKLEPSSPMANLHLATIYLAEAETINNSPEKEKLLKKALNHYTEAINKKPDLDYAHYKKAVLLNSLGDVDSAVKEAEKAIEYNKQSSDYYILLANLHLNKAKKLQLQENLSAEEKKKSNNDIQTAEKLLTDLYEQAPNNQKVLYSLTNFYYLTKNKNESDKYMNLLLKQIDDPETKQQIRKQFN